MLVGGADSHRYDLSQMTMLKDNHIWACNNSITKAVHAAKAVGGFSVKIDVECQTEEEAREAIEAGADVVMLDNFQGEEVTKAVQNLRTYFKTETGSRRQFLIEVSGGLTEANIQEYAGAGVDILSTSSIHQGVPHIDFSLKVLH
jgi:nicotinate-nucleotide pyrophosphorylase (carboxylating)